MNVINITCRRPREGQGHISDRPNAPNNTPTLLRPMTGVMVTVECAVVDYEGDDHKS